MAEHGLAAPEPVTSDRLVWVDVAKGLCIVLVVLYHVIEKQYLVSFQLPDETRAFWNALAMGFVPLRMPLFFLISGFLASASLGRPWGESLGRRVWSPYYLYVVWVLVHFAWFSFAPDVADERHALGGVSGLLLNLVLGLTSLWYLYCLAAYFVIAKVGRAFRWPSLALAGALTVAVDAGWTSLDGQLAAIGQNLVFFLLGIYLPRVVQEVSGRGGSLRFTASVATLLVVLMVVKRLTSADGLPGLLPALDVLACVAGVAVSVWAAAHAAPGVQLLARLGRSTLSIYVLHLIVLSATQTLIPSGGHVSLPGGVLAAWLYPVVLVAVCLGLSFGVWRVLCWGGMGWLFRAPALSGQSGIAVLRPRSIGARGGV